MSAPHQTETLELPVVYTAEHIQGELLHWRGKLTEARTGTGTISEHACLVWIDKWLDELLDQRGR